MKNDPYQVVIRPLITEQGTHQAEALRAYPFEVNFKANKAQIKKAVEMIYNVKVTDVRTANHKGKPRRRGRVRGTTSHWKKAVVVLHEDYRIDLF
ncbi:MAG: 50S ribosomal protein L23 [Sedimentisphaerales bacterium]|nr:50S ribosomal protein L23 [Sedimentisphaerales bacterium]